MIQTIFRCFFLITSLISTASFIVNLPFIATPTTTTTATTATTASSCSKNSISFSQLVLLATTDSTSSTTETSTNSDNNTSSSGVSHDRAAIRNLENYEAMLQCTSATKAKVQGKTVLLTGASGGLGKEIGLAICRMWCCPVNFEWSQCRSLGIGGQGMSERCPTTTTTTTTTTLTTNIIPCDLADPVSVQQLGETALQVANSGTIDILVNNGGVSSRSTFLDTQLEVDARIMQINFLAGAALAKAVVPTMIAKKQNGGCSIIWISSVQGLIGIPGRTSYAASKFAVQGYCESLRAELASSGITVHVVSPGYIRTNLSKSALTGDGTAHGRMDETTLKGRPPKEVAVTLLNAVAKGKGDIVVAATLSAKIAIWLRFFFPSLLQRLLAKRFEKERALAASTMTEEPERPKID